MSVQRRDTYRNYADLAAVERSGRDFCVDIQQVASAPTVILAPHGGGIEPGTSEIARAIAGTDLSFAIFEGIKPTDNGVLHITATNFDEPESLELVRACDNVIAIHGEGSRSRIVYTGGKDIALTETLAASLELAGFQVAEHGHLQAKSNRNICNRGTSNAGVQLELADGLRRTFFASLDRAGRKTTTEEFVRFTAAVRDGLRAAGAFWALTT